MIIHELFTINTNATKKINATLAYGAAIGRHLNERRAAFTPFSTPFFHSQPRPLRNPRCTLKVTMVDTRALPRAHGCHIHLTIYARNAQAQ